MPLHRKSATACAYLQTADGDCHPLFAAVVCAVAAPRQLRMCLLSIGQPAAVAS